VINKQIATVIKGESKQMLNSLKIHQTPFRSLKCSFTKKYFNFYITRSLNRTSTMSGREKSIDRDLIKKNIIRLDLNNPKKDYNELIKCIGMSFIIIIELFFLLYLYTDKLYLFNL
jgi:hypothetical protein